MESSYALYEQLKAEWLAAHPDATPAEIQRAMQAIAQSAKRGEHAPHKAEHWRLRKEAGRLSMLEHRAYRAPARSCYDREQFPTEGEAIEWCWARTDEEVAAVRFVLAPFSPNAAIFTQTRVEEELAGYKEKSETNKRIATEREAKRTNRARVVSETSETEHEAPPTINH